jgi:hypothetical protein
MTLAWGLGVALADNLPVFDDDAAHMGVGFGAVLAVLGQIDGPLHEFCVGKIGHV